MCPKWSHFAFYGRTAELRCRPDYEITDSVDPEATKQKAFDNLLPEISEAKLTL